MQRAKVSLPSKINLTVEEEALRIDVFWESLKHYSIGDIEKAFVVGFDKLEWFPTPAHIIGFIEMVRPKIEAPLLDWQEPTEKGRALALKMIGQLKEKWAKEDEEKEKKRKGEFERRRVALQKQARGLVKLKDILK